MENTEPSVSLVATCSKNAYSGISMPIDTANRVEQAVNFVSRDSTAVPEIGIILGTGSGILASEIQIETEYDYAQIPCFPRSTALGHKGRLLLGQLEGKPIVAMDGRFHLYEGHRIDDATMGVRVMRQLGVKTIVLTNAAGGLNPQFKSGDIMLIKSHIDLMFRTSLQTSIASKVQRPTVHSDIYDSELIESAFSCARKNDFEIQSGVYASLMGPNYETRAEYRMLRRIGADVAGMSTVPEVYMAAKLNLRVMALSTVTNVAKPDILEATSGQEVIDAAEVAAPKIAALIRNTISGS